MTARENGASPDQRRKYNEAFTAESLRLAGERRSFEGGRSAAGPQPQAALRWQQAQLGAEVGSKEVARALRARLKRAKQALDMLNKRWSMPA